MKGMENLNQAKKFFKVGQKWATEWVHQSRPSCVREIVKVTSTGCIFRNPDGKKCWLTFEDSSEFKPTENGFEYLFTSKGKYHAGETVSRYTLMPAETELTVQKAA